MPQLELFADKNILEKKHSKAMSKFNNLIVYLPNYKLLKMKTKLYNYNWTSHQSKSIAEYHYELCHWLVYLCIYFY